MSSNWQVGLAFALFCAACEAPRQERPTEPVEVVDESENPEFTQTRLRVYTTYVPQHQQRDFNGVFDLAPGQARVVPSFWKRRFNELTRPDHYGEFFLEFYDYMAFLAQAYKVPTEQKEKTLRSLEESFVKFCAVLDLEQEFQEFQIKQERALGLLR